MTKTIDSKFITGKELDEIARTKNIVLLRIKDNYYMCEIDRKEHYNLQKCTGSKEERYKVLDYHEVQR